MQIQGDSQANVVQTLGALTPAWSKQDSSPTNCIFFKVTVALGSDLKISGASFLWQGSGRREESGEGHNFGVLAKEGEREGGGGGGGAGRCPWCWGEHGFISLCCPQTELKCIKGKGTPTTRAARFLFFLPANVENTNVAVQFKLYFMGFLFLISVITA